MKVDGVLTFHRTCKATDVSSTPPWPEGAECTHVKYSWSWLSVVDEEMLVTYECAWLRAGASDDNGRRTFTK